MNKLKKRSVIFFGVMLLLVALFSTVTAASEYPTPTSVFYVNDFANVIDIETEKTIIASAGRLEELTSAQVVVVTMNDISDDSLEEYSLELFREWGIGDEEKNNGVLIFLDLGGGQSRIDVGYGLEGILPDGKTGRFQDTEMLPYYNEGNFSQGILNGFNAIVNEVYKEYGLEEEYLGNGPVLVESTDEASDEESIPPIFIIIGIVILIPLIILDFKFTGGMITYAIIRSIGRGGSGGGSGRSGGGGSAGGGGSSRRF
ncbi:MAG: TPM domain-containing protein [Eubacteriaceae bacterium]